MELTRAGLTLKEAISRIITVAHGIGVAFMTLMMLLTVSDVIMRYLFNRPIMGSFELTQFFMAILVSFGISYTAIKKGHVGVDIIISRLSRKTRMIVNMITQLLALVLFSLVSWRNIDQAINVKANGTTSSVLLIPVFPFVYVFAFGCALLSLVLLLDFIESILGVSER